MAAEVVVVLDNQNARIRILLTIEMRGRETADPAADDDEIKFLSSLNRRRGCLPKISVAQGVSSFKGTDMAATKPGKYRRIIVSCFLGIFFVCESRDYVRRNKRCAGGDRDAI